MKTTRIGGTSLGGGFFLGLASLVNKNLLSFQQILESASKGDI